MRSSRCQRSMMVSARCRVVNRPQSRGGAYRITQLRGDGDHSRAAARPRSSRAEIEMRLSGLGSAGRVRPQLTRRRASAASKESRRGFATLCSEPAVSRRGGARERGNRAMGYGVVGVGNDGALGGRLPDSVMRGGCLMRGRLTLQAIAPTSQFRASSKNGRPYRFS